MRIDHNVKDWAKSLGLVLAFLGIQMNSAIKNIIVGFNNPPLIMIASVVLLADWSNIRKLKLRKSAIFLLFVEVTLLAVAFLSARRNGQLLVFHCYLIALTFVLATQGQEVSYDHFGKILFYVSGVMSVVVCYQATEGFTKLIDSFDGTGKLWLSEGGDPVSMSRALGMNVIAILIYKKQNIAEKILAVVFVVTDVIGLLSFANRAAIICTLLLCFVWLFKIYGGRLTARKILAVPACIFLILLIAGRSEYISSKLGALTEAIENGIATILNLDGEYAADPSAAVRNAILNEMNTKINSGNVFLNYMFGLGYNYTYVDRPIFQAFFDFGMIGLVSYFVAVMLGPIKEWIKFFRSKKCDTYSSAHIIILFISLQTLLDQFYCGLPYYHYIWLPAIVFSCVCLKKEPVQESTAP